MPLAAVSVLGKEQPFIVHCAVQDMKDFDVSAPDPVQNEVVAMYSPADS
jgi:hypothetical protein